jgi:hypothetical protein
MSGRPFPLLSNVGPIWTDVHLDRPALGPMSLPRRPPEREPAATVHGRDDREMDIATRGAGNGKRSGIRFGIRWDDGRRPKRVLLPLVAALAASDLAGVAAPKMPRAAAFSA